MPAIYIREYERFEKKKTRKFFIIVFIIVIILAGGYLAYLSKDLWLAKPQITPTVTPQDILTVYYPAGQDKHKLLEKKINAPLNINDKEKGDLIMGALKGLNALPQTASLKDLAIDSSGVIYLNFSKGVLDEKSNAMTEILKTFSLVNSFLANLHNTSKVQFLVEGSPIRTPGGAVYSYKPLDFNEDLLEE
jgi:hypothetical protein